MVFGFRPVKLNCFFLFSFLASISDLQWSLRSFPMLPFKNVLKQVSYPLIHVFWSNLEVSEHGLFGYSLQIQCRHSFLIKSFLITPLFSLETTMVSIKKITEKSSNDYLICLSSMPCYFFKTLKCNLFPEKKWMI